MVTAANITIANSSVILRSCTSTSSAQRQIWYIFSYLDSPEVGGFSYERFGSAVVHTLSIAMAAGGKDKSWYFRDTRYQHDMATRCPEAGMIVRRRGWTRILETGVGGESAEKA